MIREKLSWSVHLSNLEESVEMMINSQRMVKGIEETYLLDHWIFSHSKRRFIQEIFCHMKTGYVWFTVYLFREVEKVPERWELLKQEGLREVALS